MFARRPDGTVLEDRAPPWRHPAGNQPTRAAGRICVTERADRGAPHGSRAPVAAGVVLVLVLGAAFAWQWWRGPGVHGGRGRPGGAGGPAAARPEPWADLPEGWTELPVPPEIRDGASYVWTGSKLLAWGGCDPAVEGRCERTTDGFAFDPRTRTWSTLPHAPAAGAYADAVWTGREAIFLDLEDGERVDGQAYDPQTGTWRTIPAAPLRPRWGGVRVWTGSELIVWGGGHRGGPAPQNGAAYDPATDTWRRIAEAPHGLNLASGMWTGREMLVYGSLLNGKHWADTRTSVGAAYDPEADTWRELPPSALSPQATSAVWVGGRMVAWDYEVHSQEYDPLRNAWGPPQKMPLAFSECYPDSVVVRDLVFAFFCGRAALYDVGSHAWREIHGGPLDQEVWSDAYQSSIKLWRFADLVPAGDVVLAAAEGITLNRKGVACYGCEGSPVSLWAFRPPEAFRPFWWGRAGASAERACPWW